MERGLRAFDKIDASQLFDWTWQGFERGDGVGIVLRVKESAPNRAEIGLGYSEWEKARGSIRLRNQNTLGFGEQLELLLASSDAESLARASLSGSRLFVVGLGYRVAAYASGTSPGSSLGRARRSTGRASTGRRSISRCARLSSAGGSSRPGSGSAASRPSPRTGIDLPASDDRVGALFGLLELDTLDDPGLAGARPQARRQRRVEPRGAGRGLAVLAGAPSVGSATRARRAVVAAGRHGRLSAARLPALRLASAGRVTLLPGYRHEELKGAQALAAALEPALPGDRAAAARRARRSG